MTANVHTFQKLQSNNKIQKTCAYIVRSQNNIVLRAALFGKLIRQKVCCHKRKFRYQEPEKQLKNISTYTDDLYKKHYV